MTKHLRILAGFCLLAATTAIAAEPATYALLISGQPGQAPYDRWYPDWLTRTRAYLTQTAHVPAANIVTLAGKDATTEAITNATAGFAGRLQPQDQFILFVVGHGEMAGSQPTLTVPGPDLTAGQLATALARIPAKNQVILNFSASSGDFLKHLVALGRVNLTATSPTELQEPIFAEFFLRSLETKRAPTMLEAYNDAAQQTALWIARWSESGTNTWKAAGRETVGVFEKLYPSLPNRQLDPASDRTVADGVVALRPPNGEITPEWEHRRVIDQHALLEDCGQPVGVSALGDAGLQPIVGAKPKDPGYLAGHTILGQPARTSP